LRNLRHVWLSCNIRGRGTACVRCILINQLFPSYIRYEQLERAEEYYDEVMQGQ
jgi:hypothetical protein